MSVLEHPTAQALLAEAEVSAATVSSCRRRLAGFLQRYLPRFYRVEQHELARVVLEGKLSGLQRKTSEPIAVQAGRPRKPVQHFVGAGGWEDEGVMAELRRHVSATLADRDAVLVLDPSAFPKSGADSCGVSRQWCGRLGKVENCQVGVFLAYVSAAGQALVDRRLYLPREWAEDAARREQAHVPEAVVFQENWRIGLDLLDRSGPGLPFGWVAGDDEFGRCAAFRAELRGRRLRYVLDVPCNTRIATWGRRRPRAAADRRGGGWTSGLRLSRAGSGGRSGWGMGPRGRRWSGPPRPGCRPRTRTAPSVRASGWWSCGRWTGSRRLGTRSRTHRRTCPWPSWRQSTAGGTGLRNCSGPAKAKSAWGITRSGRGWAGTIT